MVKEPKMAYAIGLLGDDLEKAIGRLRTNGFFYVEGCPYFSMNDLIADDVDEKKYLDFREKIQSNGMTVSTQHGLGCPSILTEELMEASISLVKRQIEIVSLYGCSVLIFHCFSDLLYSIHKREGYIQDNIRAFKEIASHAKNYGLKVAIEITFKAFDVLEIVNGVNSDNLGICLDTGSCYVGDAEPVEDIIPQIGPKLIATHINDEEGTILKHEHLIMGAGGVNWPEVIKAFKETGYDSPYYFELKDPPELAGSLWKRLYNGETIERNCSRAEEYRYAKKYKEAISEYEELLSSCKDKETKIDAAYNLGFLHYRSRNYDTAKQYFHKLAAEYPEHQLADYAQRYIGKCYEDEGEYIRAAEEYKKAIRKAEQNDSGYTGPNPPNFIIDNYTGPQNVARCYMYIEEYDRAVETYKSIISDNAKSSIWAKMELGVCYYKQGKAEDGRREFDEILRDYSDRFDYQHIAPLVGKYWPDAKF